MGMNRTKRKLATLSTLFAATAGLLIVVPTQQAEAIGACADPGAAEVDSLSHPDICDSSHANHRDHLNRCDVWDIYSGENWMAAWVGPDMGHLQYIALNPRYQYPPHYPTGTICVGDIAINP